MKKCTKCGGQKPLSEFSKKHSTKDGLQSHCKTCCASNYANWLTKNPNKKQNITARALQWNANNKEKRKIIVQQNNYKKRYGLTAQQKQAMIEDQGGKCAICQSDLQTTHNVCVDHCHKTNKVRGILCRKCNLGIGHLNDSIDILKSAQKYIKKYS
jgi:hypothetical protein